MNAHFQWTFWPITATAAFFGLALIEYPLGKPRRFLSLISATVIFSMQFGVYTIFVPRESSHIVFVKSIRNVVLFCCNGIILASICLTHWHGKRYYKCMKRFNEVDETLRTLGIETNYAKLRRIGLFALISWVVMCIVVNGYGSMQYARIFSDKRTPFLLFLFTMPLYTRLLTDIQFWSLLGYSGTRFDYFSSALRKLTIDDNNRASCFRNSKLILVRGVFVMDERTSRIIWTVMHLHFELCETLRDINTVFEIQLSFQMAFDYVILLALVINTFRLILFPSKVDTFKMAIWILLVTFPPLADVIVTNHLCETVGAKARTVCDMAVQLLRFMDDGGMREVLSFTVLQTKLRPLKFSCLGLYYYGHQFIYKIFSTVVTTAVIVLQLKAGLQY